MIQELHAGDRQIPASSWNEMRAAVQGITPGQKVYSAANNNPFLVTVKNVTGENLPALAIVKIDGATYTRSDDIFANAGISNGVEVDGDKPGADTDNIAILQSACGADGIVKAIASGCSPCFVTCSDSNKTYKYAKPIANNAEYLRATDDPSNVTILWHNKGGGKQAAYIKIDAQGTPTPEYFVINYGKKDGDTPTHTPTIFTKGSLHYIKRSGDMWVPSAYNEEPASSTLLKRPPGAKLVVCQIDAPNSAAECRIPYFTPESNMGVTPTYTDSVAVPDAGNRCGVKPGEHSFTSKCYDYRAIEGGYLYEPSFVATVQAQGQTGGNNQLYIDINNNQYECTAPTYDPTLADNSGPSYADIWPLDYITVLFNCENYTATALEYPRDYPEGTIMPWYRASSWSNPVYPGRGWVQYVPAGGQGEITAVQIDKNGAHYDAVSDCVWIEAGASDKIPVKEGCLCFVEKVKTNAIV